MILSRIILGMLAVAPMTGADLKRHFDSTVAHLWSADKAQIYRTLAGLVEQGLASVTVIPGTNAPDRQEHHLTDAGRAALVDWLRSELDRQPEREPFLARLFVSDALDDDGVLLLVERRRAAAVEQLAVYEGIRESAAAPADRGGRLRLATLEHGIRQARTELAWLDDLQAELS
ncbi:PadR family transcriptional regulator [Agrococcus beijingensis]|uniref:PadR family transcriptional regulator n=1 Tax=Agrococcus beijingensis TaxID=3068634 RepID=UPI002741B282|nr:PadR family transcriptional regulator [Agrococcus sp. REN33]